jgi:2-polyprenyl-6-methoxyphenol hydroxylase-like FAD-dependent oxidoreductase
MSPVAGVGINYAIQDAVSAANILAGPLAESQARLVAVDEKHLAAVQRRRELPTRVIQALQAQVQKNVLAPALGSSGLLSPAPAEATAPNIPPARPARAPDRLRVWPRASGNPAVRADSLSPRRVAEADAGWPHG